MPNRKVPAMSLEQEFELITHLRRSEAFLDTLEVLEDATMPDYMRERLTEYVVSFLEAECERACEEFHTYKRKLGLER